jgi:hypothetical protein
MRPTTTSGREVWYTAEDKITAGLRLTPVTPGKFTATISPGLNKLILFGIQFGGVS